MPLHVGEKINNKYEVIKEIGAGGMSKVYLAMDLNLNKTWAIKETPIVNTKEGRVRYKALLVETEILKKLSHPYFPRIVDIIKETDRILIVMDYIEGKNLKEVLVERGSSLSESEVVAIGYKLAEALDYLHNTCRPKIIYRDMKPNNVILQDNGSIKLLDFGISVEVSSEDDIKNATKMGTKIYASPESKATGYFDERSDIYSLGLTMYRLVTGHAIEATQLAIKPITEWNASLSKGLEFIISKCIEENPDDRYQNVTELLYDLSHYKHLSIDYQNYSRRKLHLFGGVLLSSVLLLVVGGSLLMSDVKVKSDNYNNLVQQAEIANSTSDLKKAIAINPYDLDAYNMFVKLYKADGKFTEEEEKELLGLLNTNLVELQKRNGDAYGNFAYELGTLYWFYYDVPDQLQNYINSIKWFEDAIKYNAKQSKTARLYSEIGKFYRDIALNVEEASDSGLYNKYWNKIGEALSIQYTNDLSNLQLVALVFSAIDSYGRQMVSDGVKRSSLKERYEEVVKLLDSVKPTSERAIELKNKLESQKDGILEKINSIGTSRG